MTLPEKRKQSIGAVARRIVLLEKAVDMLGQKAVAEALGISARAVRYKLSGHTLADGELRVVGGMLDDRQHAAATVAQDIRMVLA